MPNAFLGQIELFAFDAVPRGWAKCEGQLLPVNQNQALFSLLGTAYGGDGRTKFALPDLRGRVPISFSANFPLGAKVGQEAHTLVIAEMPTHGHALMADAVTTANGHVPSPTTVLGQSAGQATGGVQTFSANLYGAGAPGAKLNDAAIVAAGESRPHANRMPSLALRFRIRLHPSQTSPPRTPTVLGAIQSMIGRVTAPFRNRRDGASPRARARR